MQREQWRDLGNVQVQGVTLGESGSSEDDYRPTSSGSRMVFALAHPSEVEDIAAELNLEATDIERLLRSSHSTSPPPNDAGRVTPAGLAAAAGSAISPITLVTTTATSSTCRIGTPLRPDSPRLPSTSIATKGWAGSLQSLDDVATGVGNADVPSDRTRLLQDDPQAAAVTSSGGAKKKKVSFARNQVESVFVYQVDGVTWMNVKFKRNSLGWVIAVVMVIAHLAWDAGAYHVGSYFSSTAVVVALQIPLWELILYGFVVLAALLLGNLRPSQFSILKRPRIAANLILLALALSLHEVLKMWSQRLDPTYSPFFGPSLHFTALWVLLFRFLFQKHSTTTFWQEWVATAVVLLGASIAVIPMFERHSAETFYANLAELGASLFAAALLLQLERSQALTDSTFILYFYKNFVALIVYPLYGFFVTAHSISPSEVFQVVNVVPALLGAVLSITYYLLYFKMARYLDVLSMCGVFAGQAAIGPLALRIYRGSGYYHAFWNASAAVGCTLMVLASIVIVVFASVRRQLVARRLSVLPATEITTKSEQRKENGIPSGGRPPRSIPRLSVNSSRVTSSTGARELITPRSEGSSRSPSLSVVVTTTTSGVRFQELNYQDLTSIAPVPLQRRR